MMNVKFKLTFIAMALLGGQAYAASSQADSVSYFKGGKDSNDSLAKDGSATLSAASIYNLSTVQLPDGSSEIRAYFDSMPIQPKARRLSNPDRLELNFGKVGLNLKKNLSLEKTDIIKGVTYLKNVNGDAIVVMNLENYSSLTTRTEGNSFILKAYTANNQASGKQLINQNLTGLSKISFNKLQADQDQVVFDLADANTPVDVRQVGSKVVVKLKGVVIPPHLVQTKNFNDANSIIGSVKAFNQAGTGVIEIQPKGSYDYMAYQVDQKLSLSFTKKTAPQTNSSNAATLSKNKFAGKKLNMDFQNVEVRKILQLLATYAGVNIVASDNVNGFISLKLQDVPWDQALTVIVKTKNLAQRKEGSVIWVAPVEEVNKYEENEAKSYAQSISLAPLKTEFIQLNYATAEDVLKLVKPTSGQSTSSGSSKFEANKAYQRILSDINADDSGSLLSPRGTASVDVRTNTLIINDTQTKIEEIKRIVSQIDVPVRQVMIEARIVHASTDFSKALGVKWGIAKGNGNMIASNMDNLMKLYNNRFAGESEALTNNVNLDLSSGVSSIGTSSIALGLINTTNALLGLELSALQSEGLGEVLSSPKILTGDKQQATIRSGTKIPYQTTSDNNGTTTVFQDAVLELNVTPSITPDGNVQMKLEISKDTMGRLTNAGYVIDTNSLNTNVLVGDSETVVLGGLYEDSSVRGNDKVPVLGDIPALGKLFQSKNNTRKKQELLIFITPKIINNIKLLN